MDLPDGLYDAIHVPSLVEETESSAEGDLPYSVECKPLQPCSHVAYTAARLAVHFKFVQLVDQELDGGVDVGLEIDEISHGVHARHGPS